MTRPHGVAMTEHAPTPPRRLAAAADALRARAAVRAGSWAARAARQAGRAGGIAGGRVALAIDPHTLRRLTHGRRVVLVSGTNGKSSTTLMLAAALTAGPDPARRVATNIGGANMPDGLVAALLAAPQAHHAVLEVDELYLPQVLAVTRAAVLVLLNLSRDQLDRHGETRQLAATIRAAVMSSPGPTVVANADDPLVVWAVGPATRHVWVSAGSGWTSDSVLCPACSDRVERAGVHWACPCGLARPRPDWSLDGDVVRAPDRPDATLRTGLPGRMNRVNAVHALAAACLDSAVDPAAAQARLETISEVHGRYRRLTVGSHQVRLLLAKNPAGWQETLQLVAADAADRAGIVLAINAEQADGRDPSWLWDVALERLRGRAVVVAGSRAEDLAVRLAYAGVEHRRERDPLAAVATLPPGPVDLVGDYTVVRRVIRRCEASRHG